MHQKKCGTCEYWTRSKGSWPGEQYGECSSNLTSNGRLAKPLIVLDDPDHNSVLYFLEDFFCPLWESK